MQVKMEPGGLDLINIEDVGVATSSVGLRPRSIPPLRLASDDNPAYHTEFEDSEEEAGPVVCPPTVVDLPNASELRATPRHTLPSMAAKMRVKLPLNNSTIQEVTPSTHVYAPPPPPLSLTRPPRPSAFSAPPPPIGGADVSGFRPCLNSEHLRVPRRRWEIRLATPTVFSQELRRRGRR